MIFMSVLLGVAAGYALYRYGKWTGEKARPAASSAKPAAPEKVDRSEDTISAVHEAGHAVAASCASMVANIKSAEVYKEGGGLVQYVVDGGEGRAETDLVLAMAGLAAEMMYFGRFHATRCKSDLMKARALAEEVIVDRLPEAEDKNPPFISNVYDKPLTEHQSLALRRGYAVARRVLGERREAHAKLTGHLLHFRKLDEGDLTRFFGQRRLIRVLKLGNRLFL